MKKLVILLLFAGLLEPSASWASFYHYNRYALQISPDDENFATKSTREPKTGLVISGAVNAEQSTNYFGMIDFVLENKSENWMIMRDIRISFLTPKQNENVILPIGTQYSAWAQGTQNLLDYNQKKAALISAFLGTTLMANGQNQAGQNVGVAMTGYSLAVLATTKNYNEIVAGLPPFHLLKGDIVIPPGLFMKRELVVNSTKHKETGYIKTIVLEFKDKDGNPQKYFLQFRDGEKQNSDGWQSDFKLSIDGKLQFAE